MSQTEADQQAGGEKTGKEIFKRKGFQLFGLGRQDVIRYFFGGNASLAIVILILICIFLAREAIMFFPDHHAGLKSYRKGGQELVGYVIEEVDAHTKFYSNANIAYFAEVNRTSEKEDGLLRAYRSGLAGVEQVTNKTWDRLDRKIDAAEDLVDDIEDLVADDEGELNEKTKLERKLVGLEKWVESLRSDLKGQVLSAVELDPIWVGVGIPRLSVQERSMLREAVLFEAYPDAEDEHESIQELKRVSREKKATAAEGLVEFKATVKAMQDAVRPLKSLQSEMIAIASENRREIDKFSTAPARRAALMAGAEKTGDPEEKARLLVRADEVEIVEPDYVKLNEPLYALVPKHQELVATLEVEMGRLFQELPDSVETESAKVSLGRAEVFYRRFQDKLNLARAEMLVWHHDDSLSIVGSTSAFVLGRNWITNSSWHDFYGLLPLFTGSFLISIIALVVAVPFSIAAAIYVNQLAGPRQQQFIKPAIEFIGAIPSVVLGFFGILVFGEALRAVSQISWLEWVPGFPMAERLTILNAGLLLAFMAVPTIFTLTEDALDNVPKAFTENSIAMGATQLQTVFRVIVPTAVSGVIAAILLGFGRIIGETMVVLLVAGNKIKIPDFTEGLGVVAQPAHTMTGIIAQELGEVDNGSLHWRALFMVGMVLFIISLLVNFAAQRTLKRFQKV
tara:strand:+ start:3906 stop:5945 length:2040 start_codon:yes stop_codon:yes gene_type:complete